MNCKKWLVVSWLVRSKNPLIGGHSSHDTAEVAIAEAEARWQARVGTMPVGRVAPSHYSLTANGTRFAIRRHGAADRKLTPEQKSIALACLVCEFCGVEITPVGAL